ncbi:MULTISPECIES: replication-relaxation family protein [unclassified Nocardia]|uniref:replication-relaxation family protein n=1 Tax=unclassified Nocardia TaxID=2637762 RepID=UPI001CE417C0|nr:MULTISPECIES: replication-relaxation family protein [unclassified Nocardia]
MHCGGHPEAGPWFRLLDRDRRLLSLLAEHKVLATDQIASLEFTSTRRAQDRLAKLREMGMLFAFRESLYGGGTSQTRHALGYSGARLIAAQRAERPPTPAAHALFLERLACSPTLEHRLGINGFFAALAAYRNPACYPNPPALEGLTHWWSERQCANQFWISAFDPDPAIRPDGYGCWEQDGRRVRFFLEYDTGTETLSTVAAKLADYQDFPTDLFGILLFSLHSSRRETGLRTALRRTLVHGNPGLVIATTARDLADHNDPAGPVWAQLAPGNDDRETERLRLAELPERGPRITHHCSAGQPYNEAAFDHDDPVVRDMFVPSQPRPLVPHPTPTARCHDETSDTDQEILLDCHDPSMDE